MGRTFTGFLLMAVGFFGWDFAFLDYSGLWLGAPEWTGLVGSAAAAIATMISMVGTVIVTSPARIRRRKQRVETVIREASVAYVRNELVAAAAAVDRGLKVAADDVDLIHLAWRIALADDDPRRARQFERQLRRVDIDEKWGWELNGTPAATAPVVADAGRSEADAPSASSEGSATENSATKNRATEKTDTDNTGTKNTDTTNQR